MKRKSLLFLLLFALMAPWAANAQTTVEIGDGTSSGYYNPIGTYYNYSITEQLYTADEIGMAGSISSVSFYWTFTTAKEFNITMYMANVDAENLSTGISLAEADEVFSGTLSVPATAGWVTITLDTPFAYDGTSNLLIGFNKTGGSTWFNGNTWQYTSTSETGYMARYTQNDSSPYTTSTVPGSTSYNRPNIQMVITAGGGPVCEKPATMEASNVTSNSAVLTWTGGSGTYNVEYKLASETEWTSLLANTTATTYTMTGLTPGKDFQARVQSVCGEDVSSWKSVSFSTLFGLPLVETFGTSIPTGWSQYTGLLEDVMAGTAELTSTSYIWTFGTGNGVFDNHARVNIYGTGCAKWLVLPTLAMENNVELTFEVALTAYSGTGAPATTGTDDKFVVLANVGRGWTILRQWDNAGSEYVYNDLNTTPITVSLNLSSFAGQNVAVAFYGESTVSNADNNLHIDNVSIDYIPACPKPTNLAVNYEGNTSATVTWEGDAAGYEIDYNGTQVTGITGNSYELTGLNLGTEYEVKVRSNCGADGVSEWTNPVSFTTNLCLDEDMCILYFVTIDSYGDGWNNAYIQVTDVETGIVLAQIANTSAAAAGEQQVWGLNVCDGREIQFTWNSGNYDSECSYGVFDLNEDLLFSGSGAMSEPFNWTVSCVATPCRKPSTPEASEIGPHSVKLSWTEYGPATEWIVAYKNSEATEFTTVNTTENPFTLTGLNPESTYTVKVLPVCEVDKWSEETTFVTNVACPNPENIIVSDITATSALVSWLGFGENYDLRYMVLPESKGVATTNNAKAHRSYTYNPNDKHVQMPFVANPDAQRNVNTNANTKGSNLRDSWYYYDNGTSANPGYGGIGTGSEADVYWAVMFPAGMISETTLTKIAVYEETGYNDNPITLYVYAGGNTAPNEGELLYTEEFTTTPNNDFEEFTLSSPVTINPLQNLWIVLMENGTYPACGSTNTGDPNGRWISLDGEEWNDVTDYGLEYTWMIRAYIEGTFEPEGDWIEVNGINASEYELTGLDPTTTYLVQIRSNCGDDGQSGWSGTNFTTGDLCDLPYNLEYTDLEATSVTLNWTGSQPSYSLRYRHPVEVDPSTPATIILEAHDVWEDQSGYQMLFDADATAFGTLWNASHQILVDGEQYSGGDLPTTYYDEFEYMIPEDADGSLSTTHIVMDGSVTITIPAGTYDYVILNPSPDENYNRFYIAADNGEVPCAGDDYVFEPGVTYHFTMGKYGTGDGAALNIEQAMSDWTVVENITTDSYELTGLTPETKYQWQVMGMNCDGEGTNTEWAEIAEFTTPEQTNLTQTIALTAGVNWVSFYVETSLNDLKAAIRASMATSDRPVIKGQNASTTWNGRVWTGSISNFDVNQMYMITIQTPCEITLEGMPLDPAEHPVTINNGANWIGFPLSEEMNLSTAFAGLPPTREDVVKGQTQSASWNGRVWSGQLKKLEPGKGYIYNAKAAGTLVFPAPSKGK